LTCLNDAEDIGVRQGIAGTPVSPVIPSDMRNYSTIVNDLDHRHRSRPRVTPKRYRLPTPAGHLPTAPGHGPHDGAPDGPDDGSHDGPHDERGEPRAVRHLRSPDRAGASALPAVPAAYPGPRIRPYPVDDAGIDHRSEFG
jgi:hypothetical protein